jgi:RHS repeat-associated protein
MQDGLGSVRGLADNALTVSQAINYSPYGVPDAPITGFAFTGEWRDGTGVQYHRARYVNPALGTFLSLDPFEGVWAEPMSINGYGYVHGNPVMWTDPSGRIPFLLLAAIAAGFGAGAFVGGQTAGHTWDLARSGACGCEAQRWAQSTSREAFVNENATTGAAFGVVGGAAGVAAPVSAAIVGLGLSGINAAQAQGAYSANPNPCTEYARNVSLASLAVSTWAAVGAGIGSGGGAAPRAPQPQLVFAGVGVTSGAAQAGGIITGVGQAGGIVAGIGGGITIADISGQGENGESNVGWKNGEVPTGSPVQGIYRYRHLGGSRLGSRPDRVNKPYVGRSINLRTRLLAEMNNGEAPRDWNLIEHLKLDDFDGFWLEFAERLEMFRQSGGDIHQLANDVWPRNSANSLVRIRDGLNSLPSNWPHDILPLPDASSIFWSSLPNK